MGNQIRHNSLVKDLELILFNTRDYEKTWKFFEYCRDGIIGEVDLLAMADEIYDFYEVKCTNGSKQRNKARHQYDKFKNAFPEYNVNGYFYFGKDIIKL